VATRRAGAALEIFARCLSDKVHRGAKKRLRRIRRAAGAARDWDVFLNHVRERLPGASGREQPGLDFLFGYAQGRRAAAQAGLEDADPDPPLGFGAFLARTVADVRGPHPDHGARTLIDLARPMLLDLLRELDRAAAGDLTDYGHLHQVRIIGKRLRYAMEVFADCFGPPFREEIYPAVEAMQDVLGRANDSHVAEGHLTALLGRLRRTARGEMKRLRPGIEAELRFHRRRLPKERGEFLKWWDRWQASGSETVLTTLLQAPEAESA